MRPLRHGFAACAVAAALFSPAQAQLLNQLQGATGSNQGGGLLGAALPPVEHAGVGNTAGVLQYCIRNNYLGGDGAASVRQSLMSKVTGSGQNESYQAGSNGLLQTGNGQSYGLGGGGGVKAQVTHKVCDLVLQHAKSLL